MPNGRVVVFDPSECRVIEPEPNGVVVLVILSPFLVRVVATVPVPNERVVVLEPSERRVIEPEPNGVVVLVILSPFLVRVVAIVPVPNGRVVVFEPSERRVIEPEPNGVVVLVILSRLFEGSAATIRPESAIKTAMRMSIIFFIVYVFRIVTKKGSALNHPY